MLLAHVLFPQCSKKQARDDDDDDDGTLKYGLVMLDLFLNIYIAPVPETMTKSYEVYSSTDVTCIFTNML